MTQAMRERRTVTQQIEEEKLADGRTEDATMTTGQTWAPVPVIGAELAKAIDEEVRRTRKKWGSQYASLHECYAVILEELDELWEITRKKRKNRDPEDLRDELIQIAATAIRGLHSMANFVEVKE